MGGGEGEGPALWENTNAGASKCINDLAGAGITRARPIAEKRSKTEAVETMKTGKC